MKKSVVTLAALILLSGTNVFAFDDYEKPVSNYYDTGVQLLKSHQYTNAIAEFRKALRSDPSDSSSRIQLINCYLARAAYYNNQAKEYQKAANDLRSAIFYMKFYELTPVDAAMLDNIRITETNLNNLLSALNADKSNKGRFNQGKSLRAKGEFAAAAVEFQASQIDTKYREDSLTALGEIYYLLNLNEQAANYLERALDINPKNADAHLKLARAYERLGSIDKAANEYNSALTKSSENADILLSLEGIWKRKVELAPDDAEAHANLGAVYQKKGNLDLALSEYQKAEKLNPTNVTTRMNMGTLFQAQKNYEQAIEAYDSILRLYPNTVLAYYYKAQSLRAMNLKDAAIQNYKLALNLEPNNEDIKKEMFELYEKDMTQEELLSYLYNETQKSPSDYLAQYKYAYELHKANKLDDAILHYNQSMKLNPNYVNTYINLAQAYKQKAEFGKAKSVLTDACGLFPENKVIKSQLLSIDAEAGNTLYNNASKLFEEKKYAEAIAMYGKISPATAESLVGIGASLQAQQKNKEAAEYYKKAYALDPQNADIAYYIALAYSNINDTANAKAYARKALATDAKNKNAQELLTYVIEQENIAMMDKAIALYEQKQYLPALELLNKVIAQDPKDSNAYYYRGMIYDDQKKYAPAIDNYKKAFVNNNQLTIANYSIALDYDYLKQYQNAYAYYKKFLASTKEQNEYTRYAQKRLQDLKNYAAK